VTIPELKDLIKRAYEVPSFEAEQAIDSYLAKHSNAPVKTVREILLTGKILPWRATQLMSNVGRSKGELTYLHVLLAKEETKQSVLKAMADNKLDALVYGTFDHQPTLIPPDVLTNPNTPDEEGLGGNRRLSPILGFPAMTVPAGFTRDGLPVGIEFMARSFAEGMLLRFGYAYEQGTRNRKPPASTPALRGEP
jgi:Asp-tRNA(Asn)/Glu-tRNA(Gln) amidotransferase A subunit family amidase